MFSQIMGQKGINGVVSIERIDKFKKDIKRNICVQCQFLNFEVRNEIFRKRKELKGKTGLSSIFKTSDFIRKQQMKIIKHMTG